MNEHTIDAASHAGRLLGLPDAPLATATACVSGALVAAPGAGLLRTPEPYSAL